MDIVIWFYIIIMSGKFIVSFENVYYKVMDVNLIFFYYL